MRLHHYPGLFGDPRSRGLSLAVGASLAVHVVLFAAAGRLHTRPVERTFFAPVHFVDLVERSPGPATKPPPAAPAAAPPAPPAPAVQPPAAEPKAPIQPVAPKPVTPKPVAQKPPPAKQEPKITRQAVERLLAKPAAAEKPTPSTPATEAQIAERIARMREKFAESAQPSADPVSPAGRGTPADVRRAIDSLRERAEARARTVGDGGRRGGAQRSGTNTLQQVRFRAYLIQMADHMQRFWEVPSSLLGRNLSTIVAVDLATDGKVLKVTVEEASGSKAFDDAAIRSIYRASPFPPPPDTILQEGIGFRLNEGGITGGD
ncbi:MAG: cell envelope integrity protein TolA [Deferrisomatales bacterium]|nr:cell envelope integrity protein TolA [Deferrisomatales bacterium]